MGIWRQGLTRTVSKIDVVKQINEQHEYLDSILDLAVDAEAKEYLLPQTEFGRIQEGHGHFKDFPMPDVTMDFILKSRKIDPEIHRKGRQNFMDETKECINDMMEGKKDTFTNRKGDPLYRIEFLRDFKPKIDENLFKCLALGGRIDTDYWRRKTVEANPLNLRGDPLTIGTGKELPIALEIMENEGLNLRDLATVPHSLEEIATLEEKRVIVDKSELRSGKVENQFVRYLPGRGVCDDAWLISMGFIYGETGMIGGLIVDATDTYTKFAQNKVGGGFDEYLGNCVEYKWKQDTGKELLTDKETTDLIYLGAKNTLKIKFSSSHRRLVEKVPSLNGYSPTRPTFLHHLSFVKHGETPSVNLGFQKHPSKKFYENMRKRFIKTGRGDLLSKYMGN